MINIKELRIGNYFEYKGEIETVHTISYLLNEQHADDISGDVWGVEYKDANPIPITEEWLLRFGFFKAESGSFEFRNYFFIRKAEQSYYDFFIDIDHGNDTEVIASIRYIHQLQNLFYIVNNNELELKTK